MNSVDSSFNLTLPSLRTYQLWNEYFWSRMSNCPFVQDRWNKHREGNSELNERVSAVYRDLITKIAPTFNPEILKTLKNIHRYGQTYNKPLSNMWPSVYAPLQSRSELIDTIFANMNARGDLIPPTSKASSYLTTLENREERSVANLAQTIRELFTTPNDQIEIDHSNLSHKKLSRFFFMLLEINMDERLADIEQTISKVIDQNSQLENIAKKSYRLKVHLDDLTTLFSFLDSEIQKKLERRNLEIIKKKLEEDGLNEFEGNHHEWILFLRNHPEELAKITHLNLKGLGLNYFPPSFTSLSFVNLTEIDISNNELNFLPSSDDFFPHSYTLRSINLSNNRIKELETALLFSCRKLETFVCNQNLIRDLWNLGQNWNITTFSCWGNRIEFIGDSFGCTWENCREVALQHNHITGPEGKVAILLRENLPKTTAIKIGNVSDVYNAWENFFRTYSEENGAEFVIDEWSKQKSKKERPTEAVQRVYKAGKIEKLLAAIENEIYESQSLPSPSDHPKLQQHLSELSTLFSTMETTHRQKEEKANLRKIKSKLEEDKILAPFEGSINDWISYLERNPEERKKIFRLKLSGIDLTYLPPRFTQLQLENLTHVDFSDNQLNFLPEDRSLFPLCPKITHVNLSRNGLTRFSTQMFSHCMLKEFRFDRNNITDLKPLFQVPRKWAHLQILSGSDNQIELDGIPPTLSNILPNIKGINLRMNNILQTDQTSREILKKFKSSFNEDVVITFETNVEEQR